MLKTDPKENPISRIEHLALRLHPNVTPHLQINGSYVLRRADVGRYTPLPSSDWAILSRLDGVKKIGDLLRERLEQGKGLGIVALVRRVIDLREKGFLIPESKTVLPDRKPGMLVLGFRLPLPKKVSGIKKVWPWIGLLLCSSLFATGFLITEPLPMGTLSDGLFLAIWGSASLILSVRSIFSTVVLAQAGTRPWRIGVAWAVWVPFFFIDARDLMVAERKARVALALSEFSSATFVVAAFWGIYQKQLLPPNRVAGLVAGALLVLWFMFRPFGNSPLMELARALTQKELIWHDARAYLSRRLWIRAFERGEMFPSEGIFILLALIYPVWGYIGLVLFGEALAKGFFPAFSAVLNGGGASPAGAWLLLGTSLVGVAIAVGGAVGGGLWWIVRFWQERRPGKTQSPQPSELDTIIQVLADVPFFASLPQETLRLIASDSKVIRLPPRAFAVRQNTMGDQFFVIRKGRMAVLRQYESGREEKVAELLPKDAFGEMALLMDSARTASVQALSPVELISISRPAFEKAVAATSLRRAEVTLWLRISQQLRHSPLFAEMSANEVAYFLKRSQRRPVPKGETLIREGDVGSHFYIVLSGKFDVHRKGEKIGTLTAGDFVGEIALLVLTPRTATVTAVEPAQVLELSRVAFFETLALNVSFGSKIIETARERRKGVGV